MREKWDAHRQITKITSAPQLSNNSEPFLKNGTVLDAVDHIIQTYGTLEFLDLLPCGISIATDPSCETIIHNTMAANLLRVEKWGNFSHSANVPPPVEIHNMGQKILPQDMPMQRAAWNGETVVGFELELIWPDGVRKFSLWNARPLRQEGVISGVIATCEDITESKRLAGEQVEYRVNSQTHQHTILKGINQILLSAITSKTEEDFGHICLSILEEATQSQMGFIGEINQEGIFDNIAISHLGWNACKMPKGPKREKTLRGFKVHGIYGHVLLNGKSYFTNAPFSHKDSIGLPAGHPEIQSFLGVPLTAEGNTVGMIGLANRAGGYRNEDLQIVEIMSHTILQAFRHKRTQQELVKKNHQVTALITSITDPFFSLDCEWCFTFFNPSASKINPLFTNSIIGRKIWEVFPDLIGSELFFKYQEAYISKKPLQTITKDPTKNGWLDVNIYPYADGIFVYYKDISERVKYENELSRLDRLNVIGEMAASIGHEVRNPMTTVRGFLQIFQRKEKFAQYRQEIDTMIEELDRANNIITEFLSLAKDKVVLMKLGNINDTIYTLYPLLQADALTRGHEVKVETKKVPEFYFDEKGLRQLILNLVRNGLEAMDKHGVVTIRTFHDDECITLEIEDMGKGIPEHVMDKLGTPFVTTKANGTGLGLPVCYRIADRQGANIQVKTGPTGTLFTICFRSPTV